MAGYREFQTGEVLTAANVNDYLAKQSVMKFADSSARDTALGTAVGGSNALREGMVAYLDDTDEVLVYDGSAWGTVRLPLGTATPTDGQILAFGTATSTWNPTDPSGGFDSSVTITATNSSWSVPASADGIFKVTVIGGGGGGGSGTNINGADGNPSSFACSAGTATAAGGSKGYGGSLTINGANSIDGFVNGNGGMAAVYYGTNGHPASDGLGGGVTVAYFDLTGVSTANVTVGAGGAGGVAGGVPDGGDGGDGAVVVEYRSA